MSHNVTVKNVNIPTLSVVERAVRELQSKGRKISISDAATKFRGYQGSMTACERAIKIEGSSYEIGVVAVEGGGYTLSYDQMMVHHDNNFKAACGGVAGSIGVDGKPINTYGGGFSVGQLTQLCNVIAAEDQAGYEGHMCTRSYDEKTKQYVLEIEEVG